MIICLESKSYICDLQTYVNLQFLNLRFLNSLLNLQFTNLCKSPVLKFAVLKFTVKIAIIKPMQIHGCKTCSVKLRLKYFESSLSKSDFTFKTKTFYKIFSES